MVYPKTWGGFPPVNLSPFGKSLVAGVLVFLFCLLNEGISSDFFVFVTVCLSLFLLYRQSRPFPYPVPLLLLFGYTLYQGIMIVHANAPKFAYVEFSQSITAFCVLLFALFPKRSGKEIATALVVASSLFSVISVDLISTRWISGAFQFLINHLTLQYSQAEGLEAGVRITSILGNPNVFGGIVGMGVLFSLALSLEEEENAKRYFFLSCLFVNSCAFVLAFSMGATFTILLAFVLYFCLERQRIALLILMIETFVLVLLSAFAVFLTSFEPWTQTNHIPLTVLVLGSVFLSLVHQLFGRAVARHFEAEERKSLLPLFLWSFLGIAFALVALASQWTTALSLDSGESVKRSLYLAPGDYQLEVTTTEPFQLSIVSQSREQTVRHTDTRLYSGDSTAVEFTVPEDSVVQYFTLKGLEETRVEAVTVSNGAQLKLQYVLLPGFIATRLQGLFANENMSQRFIFFEDGLKVFWERPLFGSGLGAFAVSIFRVQSFYYETLYVHNHYIQVLMESGILGGSLLFSCLGLLLWGLWQRRRQPLGAVSLSTLVFCMSHATMELAWSSGAYIVLLYFSFALYFHLFAQEELADMEQLEALRKEYVLEKADLDFLPNNAFQQNYGRANHPQAYPFAPPLWWVKQRGYLQQFIMGGLLLYALCLSGNFNADYLLALSDEDNYLSRLQIASWIDPFETSDHQLSYVVYAMNSQEPEHLAQAEKYIQVMDVERSNVLGLYYAEYYFRQNCWAEGISYLKLYITNRISHPTTWNNAFALWGEFQENMGTEMYTMGLWEMYDMATQWTAENLGDAVISQEYRQELDLYPREGSW